MKHLTRLFKRLRLVWRLRHVCLCDDKEGEPFFAPDKAMSKTEEEMGHELNRLRERNKELEAERDDWAHRVGPDPVQWVDLLNLVPRLNALEKAVPNDAEFVIERNRINWIEKRLKALEKLVNP